MNKFSPVILVLLGLAACAGEPEPNGYFDSLTPDPSRFERRQQEQRLIEAEINAAQATTADAPMDGGAPADQMAATDPTLSRTQDFSVITEQETIESDAARLRSLAADYQVIQPEPLPERANEVNLAAYAINQTNQVGNKIYIRRNAGNSRCFAYRDADEAQRVFLAAGGPKRDVQNLDVDGDGFACDWRPDAYRALVQ